MTQSTLSIAIDQYRAAEVACDDYERDVHSPGLLAFNVAIAAIPHRQTAATFINGDNERRSLSTASVGAIAVARRVLRDVKDGHLYGREVEADNADYLAAVRELAIAADRRELEMEQLRTEHDVEAMEAHSTKLAREAGAARDAAFATPLASVSDLRIKAELIAELECWDIAGEHLVADLQRLSDAEGR